MTLKSVVPGYWKLLVAIYFCSLLVRIAFFSTHIPFSQDNVRDVMLIRQHISDGDFLIPFGPSTSVGAFSLPPFYYYLQLAAQLLFFNKFYSMDILVILIESLTPVVLYYLALKITRNKFSSIGVSALYILSPAVLLASNAWNPNLVPFFSLLFITSFLLYLTEKKSLWQGVGLISFAMLTNLHFQWFVLLPFALFLFVAGLLRIKKTWKVFLVFIVTSLILFSPYIYYESLHQFSNSRSAINFLSERDVIFERVRKPAYVAFFFPNYFHRVLFNNSLITGWEGQYDVIQLHLVINSLLFWSLFVFCLKVGWQQFKNDKRPILLIYMGIFLLMMVFLRFYKGDKLDYYLHVFLSFIFVFIGSVFESITKHKNTVLKLVPFVVIAAIEIVTISSISTYNDYASYKKITDKIIEIGQSTSLVVEPQNKELVRPLEYFLSNKVTMTAVEEANYRVLFCYKHEGCQMSLTTNESFAMTEGAFTGAFFKVK